MIVTKLGGNCPALEWTGGEVEHEECGKPSAYRIEDDSGTVTQVCPDHIKDGIEFLETGKWTDE